MAQVTAQDVTLIRGSVNFTINSVVYSAINFSDEAKARMDKDYATSGKYRGASTVEDSEEITCQIRARSDQAAPPKFVVFSYNSLNWYIYERKFSGSQAGVQVYDCTIIECPSGVITLS